MRCLSERGATVSNHAGVIVFYGICYESESEGEAKFHSDDGGETEGVNSPAWMAANLHQESREGVEVVRYGHYDCGGRAVAVAGTVIYGGSWTPLKLKPRAMLGSRGGKAIRAYCEKHGLPWSKPKWWAVPYYG